MRTLLQRPSALNGAQRDEYRYPCGGALSPAAAAGHRIQRCFSSNPALLASAASGGILSAVLRDPVSTLRRLGDAVRPPDGGGSFRIWGEASVPDEPWWPADDDDPASIERAARHPYWHGKPRERRLMLEEAERLRR
jgi:hypothetical protein